MKPAPPQSPHKPRKQLTERDIAILLEIARLRFLTRLDIATFPACADVSESYLRKILATLAGGKDTQPNQYLCRFPRPQTSRGSIEKVYTLGALGRTYLRDELSEQVDWWHGPGKVSAHSFSYLLHQLTLSRLVCAARSWVSTQSQFTLIEELLCYELSRRPEAVTGETLEDQTPLPVVPDAWLLFENADGGRYPLLLEIDRGTEYKERFKQHIHSRVHFILSGDYSRFFGVEAVCIAYITTGITPEYRRIRLERMRQWTQEVVQAEISEKNRQAWSARFRFTSLAYEEIYQLAHALFSENVWQSPDNETLMPLWSKTPQLPPEENDHGADDFFDEDLASD